MEKASSTAGGHHVHGKTQHSEKQGLKGTERVPDHPWERRRGSPGPPLGKAQRESWTTPGTHCLGLSCNFLVRESILPFSPELFVFCGLQSNEL